ncbi:hypothetical protein APR04_000208 [Promicromonospora umidemergens]|uniref:RiboL-PSP-HEPN domain-containing protein n=1 Tax=Promicromonospora umidemergens TaxID=629679 RepID=A0ABP8X7P9_9MICO|nr:hypothetical protein [Promicromonospora umidemergens]MCP2281319.1 hypothetical protein [Promicromonospora umidemergens]
MPSDALEKWRGARAARLDNLVAAHRAVAGDGAGRRWLTVEVNHALIVRLASEFQGFCRELHDEAIDSFLASTFEAGSPAAPIVRRLLTSGRKLDSGNAGWANVNNDFARLGMSIKAELTSRYPKRSGPWTEKLERLNTARNAIAHDNSTQLAECHAEQPLTMVTFRACVRAWTRWHLASTVR